ncbi:MAG: hypothetical protein LBT26_09285, partial [Clostridiales Family XIII bacterium]|nr:hypothetical protein [Clostridiales Family XIII bacterium]
LGGECGVFNPELLISFEKSAHLFLDPEMIKAKSEPASSASGKSAAGEFADEALLSGRTLELLEWERAKIRTLKEMSEDLIFDYDSRTDVMHFSKALPPLAEMGKEIPGFRHVLFSMPALTQEQKERILNEVLKLNRQNPKITLALTMTGASGGAESYETDIHALFENEESEEKTGYIGKMKKADEKNTN